MSNILVPTDFSDNARNALKYGLNLFNGLKRDFILYHTFIIENVGVEVMPSKQELEGGELKRSLAEELEFARDISKEYDVSVKEVLQLGDFVHELKNTCKKEDVSMVIMGTKGAGLVQGLILGSNAAAAVQNIKSPLLVVPEDTAITTPKKMVFAVDAATNITDIQMSEFLEIANNIKADIYILHVIPEEVIKSEYPTNSFSDKLGNLKHSYHFISNDNVVEGLETFVLDNDIDLLVMPKKKLGFFESIFHESITKKMTLHSKIPILILPY